MVMYPRMYVPSDYPKTPENQGLRLYVLHNPIGSDVYGVFATPTRAFEYFKVRICADDSGEWEMKQTNDKMHHMFFEDGMQIDCYRLSISELSL